MVQECTLREEDRIEEGEEDDQEWEEGNQEEEDGTPGEEGEHRYNDLQDIYVYEDHNVCCVCEDSVWLGAAWGGSGPGLEAAPADRRVRRISWAGSRRRRPRS